MLLPYEVKSEITHCYFDCFDYFYRSPQSKENKSDVYYVAVILELLELNCFTISINLNTCVLLIYYNVFAYL